MPPYLSINRVAAFKVMMAYLKLFQKSSEEELAAHQTEREAKRCVILGVQVPTVIDFADVLQLAAVKRLATRDKEVFDFMDLFTKTDSKQFAERVKSPQFSKLMAGEGLQLEDVIRKK
jgi:hypothetical protein